jgi:hypothetical protein
LPLQYAESNYDADYLSFKFRIANVASTSKQSNEENVLDILNESDECLTCDSSDDSDNCEDDIAFADAAVVEEDSDVEEHSLGETDYITVALFRRTWTIIVYRVNYFLVILDLKTQQ